jgi:hypothetical protein
MTMHRSAFHLSMQYVASMRQRPVLAWSRQWLAGPRPRTAARTAVLMIVLLLLIPPHGILSANEEDYFALAERFIGGSA